jgi:hypothetical protein
MAKLAADDWNSVSLAKLRTVWPTELSGLDCDAEVCHSVWSKDRIIAGHCECCATFAFTIHKKGDGKRVEQFEEVVLNYSTAERNLLVEAAKRMIGAAGLSATDVAALGSADEQDFHWAAGENELSTIEVCFKHCGKVWELFLNWGHVPLEPSPTKPRAIPVSVSRTDEDKVGTLFLSAFNRELSQSTTYQPMFPAGMHKGLRFYVELATIAVGDGHNTSAVSVVVEDMGLPSSYPVATKWYHKLVLIDPKTTDTVAQELVEDIAARWCNTIKNSVGNCPREKIPPLYP